jgi:hypothetical protein
MALDQCGEKVRMPRRRVLASAAVSHSPDGIDFSVSEIGTPIWCNK